ncbi:hypothetical protein BEN78_16140 [Xanthomonas citri pv. mangiferaeindicae]|nr:hypothetical protein BEN78_16140 [Xanthomonas citri pv. mangiferaeindicae]
MHTPQLWTIGHSTRPIEVFIDMLRADGITALVDVRRHPGSRRHPHFSAQSLAHSLPEAGIVFVPMPELGGRRQALADSPHTAWRNASFRGYADYMDTAEYAQARTRLMALAHTQRTACMCAEAMWWSCHRSLIADDFKARGWEVVHLMGPGKSQPHPWTAAARIVDGRLDYSAPAPPQDDLFAPEA